MRLLPSLLAASLLVALSTTPALAGGPPGTVTVEPNVEPAAPTRTVRYGKQIVLADLIWVGATALVSSIDHGGEGVGALIGLGYFATGPIVHLRQGNSRGAAKSLAARALLPAGGMLIGGLLASSAADDDDSTTDDEWDDLDDSFAVIGGMVLGGMVGMVSAVVLDWTTFSKKTVEGRPARWSMAPNVKMSKHSASVGVAGKF